MKYCVSSWALLAVAACSTRANSDNNRSYSNRRHDMASSGGNQQYGYSLSAGSANQTVEIDHAGDDQQADASSHLERADRELGLRNNLDDSRDKWGQIDEFDTTIRSIDATIHSMSDSQLAQRNTNKTSRLHKYASGVSWTAIKQNAISDGPDVLLLQSLIKRPMRTSDNGMQDSNVPLAASAKLHSSSVAQNNADRLLAGRAVDLLLFRAVPTWQILQFLQSSEQTASDGSSVALSYITHRPQLFGYTGLQAEDVRAALEQVAATDFSCILLETRCSTPTDQTTHRLVRLTLTMLNDIELLSTCIAERERHFFVQIKNEYNQGNADCTALAKVIALLNIEKSYMCALMIYMTVYAWLIWLQVPGSGELRRRVHMGPLFSNEAYTEWLFVTDSITFRSYAFTICALVLRNTAELGRGAAAIQSTVEEISKIANPTNEAQRICVFRQAIEVQLVNDNQSSTLPQADIAGSIQLDVFARLNAMRRVAVLDFGPGFHMLDERLNFEWMLQLISILRNTRLGSTLDSPVSFRMLFGYWKEYAVVASGAHSPAARVEVTQIEHIQSSFFRTYTRDDQARMYAMQAASDSTQNGTHFGVAYLALRILSSEIWPQKRPRMSYGQSLTINIRYFIGRLLRTKSERSALIDLGTIALLLHPSRCISFADAYRILVRYLVTCSLAQVATDPGLDHSERQLARNVVRTALLLRVPDANNAGMLGLVFLAPAYSSRVILSEEATDIVWPIDVVFGLLPTMPSEMRHMLRTYINANTAWPNAINLALLYAIVLAVGRMTARYGRVELRNQSLAAGRRSVELMQPETTASIASFDNSHGENTVFKVQYSVLNQPAAISEQRTVSSRIMSWLLPQSTVAETAAVRLVSLFDLLHEIVFGHEDAQSLRAAQTRLAHFGYMVIIRDRLEEQFSANESTSHFIINRECFVAAMAAVTELQIDDYVVVQQQEGA